MKNNNRKKQSRADYVIEREGNTNSATGKRKANGSHSSSEFSQFQMNPNAPKNVDDDDEEDFSPFIKPKCWEYHPANSPINRKGINKEAKHTHKDEQKHGKRKQKKGSREQCNANSDKVCAMKNQSQTLTVGQNTTQKYSKGSQNKQQSLIVQHDKRQFNKKGKQQDKHSNKQKSPTKRSNVQEGGNGMMERKGGVCFEVSTKDFPSQQNKKAEEGKERGKAEQKNEVINSNEEILRRRQTAFRYGEIVRHRTFGYR